MREETKQLLQSKLRRWDAHEQSHRFDAVGQWVHVRDIKSIINCETELLKNTISTRREMQQRIDELYEGLKLAKLFLESDLSIINTTDGYYHFTDALNKINSLLETEKPLIKKN